VGLGRLLEKDHSNKQRHGSAGVVSRGFPKPRVNRARPATLTAFYHIRKRISARKLRDTATGSGKNPFRSVVPLLSQEEAFVEFIRNSKPERKLLTKPHKRGPRRGKLIRDRDRGEKAFNDYLAYVANCPRLLQEGMVAWNKQTLERNRIHKADIADWVQKYHRANLKDLSLVIRGKTVMRRKYRKGRTVYNKALQYYVVAEFAKWVGREKHKLLDGKVDRDGTKLAKSILGKEKFVANCKAKNAAIKADIDQLNREISTRKAAAHRHQQMRASQEARERDFE